MDSETCDAIVIRDLAATLSDERTIASGAKPFISIPDNHRVHNLEEYLPRPLGIRAKPNFDTLDGLIAYVEAYKGNETAIFVSIDNGTVVAIIDYHGKPGGIPVAATATAVASAYNPASWCSHRATHTPRQTIEWKRWIEKNDQWQDQRPFAEFIENNVADIRNPAGAAMLEIASTLEAKTAVTFSSGVRLDNGSNRLTFNSDTTAKAGEKGSLDIPQQFELALVPFIGGEAYPVVARFRYKIDEGKLKLRYQLINPHKVIEAAVGKIIERIGTGTGVKPFIGQP